MLEEAKAILLQHGGVAANELVEDGIIILLVSQGDKERAYHLARANATLRLRRGIA